MKELDTEETIEEIENKIYEAIYSNDVSAFDEIYSNSPQMVREAISKNQFQLFRKAISYKSRTFWKSLYTDELARAMINCMPAEAYAKMFTATDTPIDDHNAITLAALHHGNTALLQGMLAKIPVELTATAVKAAFHGAALGDQGELIKVLVDHYLKPGLIEELADNNYKLFCLIAQNKCTKSLAKIIEIIPRDTLSSMLEANDFEIIYAYGNNISRINLDEDAVGQKLYAICDQSKLEQSFKAKSAGLFPGHIEKYFDKKDKLRQGIDAERRKDQAKVALPALMEDGLLHKDPAGIVAGFIISSAASLSASQNTQPNGAEELHSNSQAAQDSSSYASSTTTLSNQQSSQPSSISSSTPSESLTQNTTPQSSSSSSTQPLHILDQLATTNSSEHHNTNSSWTTRTKKSKSVGAKRSK
jgi:hypothetical protein